MRIFHVATAADWAAAERSGRYTTSTRGRTLAEEGFIHAARGDQWQGVRARFYADVAEPLVLLVVDTERLSAPVVEESVPDSHETFPHVYGAIEASAVVQAIPLDAETTGPTLLAEPAAPPSRPRVTPPATTASTRTFFSLFLEEFSVRAGLALVVIVVAVLVGLLVLSAAGDVPGLVTMLALLVLGLVAVTRFLRRREKRIVDKADSGA